MKKTIALIAIILLTYLKSFSQVTGVNFWVNYNDVDSVFDCYIIITEGNAVTSNQRKLLVNQYTIVVPSGNMVSVVDNYNPINNNENYTGTIPVNWNLSSIVQNPISSPGNDIIAFTASPFGQHFNNLNVNDTLKLFSITVSPEICPNTIRLFENNIDPNSSASGMQSSDFSQQIAIGFPPGAYEANSPQGGIQSPIGKLPENYNPVIGNEFLLIPSFTGTWESNNSLVATVNTNGLVQVIDVGYVSFTYTNSYDCENTTPALSIPQPDPPIIVINGPDVKCGNDSIPLLVQVIYSQFPAFTYLWNTGGTENSILVSPPSNTTYSVTVTDSFGGTTIAYKDINVFPKPIISITGSDSICVNTTTSISPSTGGIWESNNIDVANITNSGIVTGINGGKATFTFTLNVTGCSSLPSDSVTIFDIPNVVLIGQDIIFVGDSTYLTPQAGGTWASSDNDIAIISNDGIVTSISPGFVTFTYTSNTTNCSSTSQAVHIINQLPPLSCNVGTIVFSNQDQVDAFPTNFPGCTIIEGNVGITGAVQNLDSLIQITKIIGSVSILNTTNLNNLNGLNNINRIGGSLSISGLSQITNLSSFTSLDFIGANFEISNSNVNSFSGLSNLDSIGHTFNIINISNNIMDLSGINSLNYVGSNINLRNPISFGSINFLDTIRGNLLIYNTKTTDLNFPNLKKIHGYLTITNSSTLTQISGFNLLNSIGYLQIYENPFLSSISGFDHTISQFSAIINNCPFLTECNIEPICTGIWSNSNSIQFENNGIGCSTIQEIQALCGSAPDSDNDGINDYLDNCINIPNPNQADENSDSEGDVCDSNSDSDNDTVVDSLDNCVSNSNTNQEDANFDGEGDVCDINSDTDGDGQLDAYDNCINTPNPNQADANNDGEGNVCDSNSDSDNDTVIDSLDNCVTTLNPNQADANNDGEGDICDNNSDSDNDGKNDYIDNCPSIFNPDQRDCNNNNIGDVCEGYVDNDCDAIANASDNCPDLYNPYQIDYNNNSIGDACENFPKVGFNTTQPKTEMHLSYSNLYLDHPEKGLIVKDHNGNCFKTTIETVSGQSQLKLVAITCP